MFRIQHRRRIGEKTNFRKRLALLKSGKCRVVVRRSLSGVSVQFVEYRKEGDHVLCSANSADLKKLGWKAPVGNLPAAYLIGMIAGSKAKKAGVKDAVADLGLYRSTKGARIYAVLKGVIDAGINMPCSKEIVPSEERIKGAHIAAYAKSMKPEVYKIRFSKYLSAGSKPEEIEKEFMEVKAKIK